MEILLIISIIIIFFYLLVFFYVQYKYGKHLIRKNAIAIGLMWGPIVFIDILSFLTILIFKTKFQIQVLGCFQLIPEIITEDIKNDINDNKIVYQ